MFTILRSWHHDMIVLEKLQQKKHWFVRATTNKYTHSRVLSTEDSEKFWLKKRTTLLPVCRLCNRRGCSKISWPQQRDKSPVLNRRKKSSCIESEQIEGSPGDHTRRSHSVWCWDGAQLQPPAFSWEAWGEPWWLLVRRLDCRWDNICQPNKIINPGLNI